MYNVLIVDDDAFILEGLKHIIDWESYGVRVSGTAANGEIAVEFIQNHPVDILLTDIRMPVLGGIELIGRIRREKWDIRCVILSGYDDFSYMQQAIKLNIENYLIKPINERELTETISNIVEKMDSDQALRLTEPGYEDILKENVLYRWMNNRIEQEELFERAHLLKLPVNDEEYIVSILRLDKAGKALTGYELQHVSRTVGALCREQSTLYSIVWFVDFEDEFVLAFNGAALDKAEIKRFLNSMAMQLQQTYAVDYFITTGLAEKGYRNIHLSHQSAKHLTDYSLMLPPNRYIDVTDMAEADHFIKLSLATDFNGLKKALLENNQDKSLEFIDDIFSKEYEIGKYPPDYLKSLSINLLFELIQTAKTANPEFMQEGRQEGLYGKVMNARSRQELHGYVRESYARLFLQPQSKKGPTHPLVERVIAYICANYSNDSISLKSLSSGFHANAAYLGRIFKEETGEGIVNYINQYRIQKAKELLSGSKYSASEIARMVGYSNFNHFSNMFKRYTGFLPTQYRNVLVNSTS